VSGRHRAAKVTAGRPEGREAGKQRYIKTENKGKADEDRRTRAQRQNTRGEEHKRGNRAKREAHGRRAGRVTGEEELRRGHIEIREVTERSNRTEGPPGAQGTHMRMGINKFTDVRRGTKVSKRRGEGKEGEPKANRGARTGG